MTANMIVFCTQGFSFVVSVGRHDGGAMRRNSSRSGITTSANSSSVAQGLRNDAMAAVVTRKG